MSAFFFRCENICQDGKKLEGAVNDICTMLFSRGTDYTICAGYYKPWRIWTAVVLVFGDNLTDAKAAEVCNAIQCRLGGSAKAVPRIQMRIASIRLTSYLDFSEWQQTWLIHSLRGRQYSVIERGNLDSNVQREHLMAIRQ
jgi:hypothetical protein